MAAQVPQAPGVIELPGARRRRELAERRTIALGATALVATAAVIVIEVARVWRRGDAPLPAETLDVGLALEQAIEQTVEVAVAGYQGGSNRENALFNLLVSFTITFGIARASTAAIRRRGRFGPFRNLVVGKHHVHHFVPGIVLAFIAGGASIISRGDHLEPYLAVPFGVGVALTLDESALLLKLDDVYWSEEGIVSVQVTFATLLMLSALALALRLLRRGEEQVLGPEPSAPIRSEDADDLVTL
jgi:hypothetical protein